MVGGISLLGPGSRVRFAADGGGGGGVVPSSFKKLTIYDVGNRFRGQKVLIRVDFNGVAQDGKLKSTGRLDAALESIRYALDQGASQVILISHNGRYKDISVEGGAAKYSLAPVAAALQERLHAEVSFVAGFDQPVTSVARVVLMENTRADAGDEKGDIAYARKIVDAVNPDIYVLDGFSVAHRDQASVTLIAKLMKESGRLAVAGSLLAKEYEFFIDRIVKSPALPFLVFLGGSKVGGKGGKLPILNALLPAVDRLVVGGAMAFPFLLVQKGDAVAEMDPFKTKPGRTEELAEEVKQARAILEDPANGYKVIVPTLVVGADGSEINVATTAVPAGFVMRDSLITGESEGLRAVPYRTIFFNGTFGAYEDELGGHVKGTHQVFAFMANSTNALTIPGGGDTAEVLKGFKKTDAGKGVKFGHETMGGGASGDLITHGFAGRAEELPGFACLTNRE